MAAPATSPGAASGRPMRRKRRTGDAPKLRATSKTLSSMRRKALVAACTPSQTVTGPDGHSYRVDTYVVSVVPSGGAAVKQITVVVRKPGLTSSLARVVSTAGLDF